MRPEFRSFAERVLVDLVVTDRKHRPILGLTAADFDLKVDGQPREIISFAAFGTAAMRALEARNAAPSAENPGLDPTTPQFVRAATVLLIDEGHLTFAESAKLGPLLTHVLRALAHRGGDLLVLTTHSGVRLAGRLPEDVADLAQAAGRIRGQRWPQLGSLPMTDAEALEVDAGYGATEKRLIARFKALNPGTGKMMESLVRARAVEIAAEVVTRRRTTFEALESAIEWLAERPGRHTVLMVSPGFPNDPSDPAFRELATRSLRANAPIHFVDVGEATPPFGTFETIAMAQGLPAEARVPAIDAWVGAAGADRLATSTGGLRVGGTNVAKWFERVLDTTRTYYVVGFDPPRDRKPGFRKVEIKVRRKGARVLARKGYFDDTGPTSTN